jgi:hypothetical protein
MAHLRLLIDLLVTLLLSLGCVQDTTTSQVSSAEVQAPPPPPASPDVGDVSRFLNCSAAPRRALSPRERCEITAFKDRCTALDDCYVSCLSSPAGVFTGGGCGHVCTLGLHPGALHPAAVDACESIPGESGLEPRLGPNSSFKPKPLRGSA